MPDTQTGSTRQKMESMKRNLEAEFLAGLEEFENETGLRVTNVRVDRTETSAPYEYGSGPNIKGVNIEAQLGE